jgi:ABC-type siderophore export system fused ATPase/permease subunit
MKALKILQSKSKYFYLLMILFGMMSSVMYGGILFFINQIIGQKPLPYFPEYGWLLYLIILVASFVISKVLQSYMISTTGDIIYRYEISILQRLRFASFQNFEKIDNEKIYTAVWDARVLGSLPEVFINLVKSLIVVVYGTVYLFWVSIYGELLVLGLMTGLLVTSSATTRSSPS